MRSLYLAPTVVALAIALVEPASAATFTVTPIQNGQAIVVEGQLMDGDDQRFEQVIPPNVPILVDFNSPGGNLLAGLAIGAVIHDRGFNTTVLDNQSCA